MGHNADMPDAVTEMPPLLLTEKEAARLLRIPVITLRKWRWQRKPGIGRGVPHVKIGRLARYERAEVLAFIKQCSTIAVENVARREEKYKGRLGGDHGGTAA